jgi:predicted nucleic acid-binding protein
LALTFVDSSLLIAAAQGEDELYERAMEILDDPDRVFISSDFVRLEVLPKPIFHGYDGEAAFYRTFFENVTHWASASPGLTQSAFEHACRSNLSACDALHVAAAELHDAVELVTAESHTKPICQVRSPRVRSIRPETT